MQFNIRTLLALMVVASVFCGIVFAAPPIVATPILIGLLWITPSLWINGIIYGRGAWRPFFIGGTIAGLGPHLGAVYYTAMVAVQLLDSNGWTELLEGDRLTNLMVAAVFLFPGVFALLGGLMGVWTWWMLQPAKAQSATMQPASESPKVDEYVIVSGRLTAVPPRQALTPD
jgi:hypothetical protein